MHSSIQGGKIIDEKTNHYIDMVMLAIVFVGFFSCLIRTDYNLIIILFCYFLWQNRKDALSLKIISGAVIILFVVDLLFAITELPVWTDIDPVNHVWQTIRPLHNFGIFCYALINLLKVILLVLTCKASRSVTQSQTQ